MIYLGLLFTLFSFIISPTKTRLVAMW